MPVPDSQLTLPPARPPRTVVGATRMSSMRITGELALAEDFFLAGEVIGNVEMREHQLTVTSTGRIEGDIHAKSVVVLGEVYGNITASLRLTLGDGARVVGTLTSPRISMAAGAFYHGAVDMQLGDEFWNRRQTARRTSPVAVASNTAGGPVRR